MTKTWDRRRRVFSALMVSFCAGALTDGWLRTRLESTRPRPKEPAISAAVPVGTIGPVASGAAAGGARAGTAADARSSTRTGVVAERPPTVPGSDPPAGPLRLPIDGVNMESLKGSFAERRGGRPHDAIDIIAPRNTPVHAVQDGTIAKLFYSKAGGNTIYQFDPNGRLVYYYAHLERYVDGLKEGQPVSRGDILGYVGTTGNAAPDAPHLHFAVSVLDPGQRWWQGQAVDPYPLFHR